MGQSSLKINKEIGKQETSDSNCKCSVLEVQYGCRDDSSGPSIGKIRYQFCLPGRPVYSSLFCLVITTIVYSTKCLVYGFYPNKDNFELKYKIRTCVLTIGPTDSCMCSFIVLKQIVHIYNPGGKRGSQGSLEIPPRGISSSRSTPTFVGVFLRFRPETFNGAGSTSGKYLGDMG